MAGHSKNCLICSSNDIRIYASWADFHVVQCSACGFRFIDTLLPDYPENAQYAYDEPEIGPTRPELSHIQRRVRDILRFKKPPGKALDIGCGKGELATALSERGFSCSGIDINKRIIDHLQNHYPQVSWLHAQIKDLLGFSEKFDVITMYHVLEHMHDPISALKIIRQLANPNSLVVIEVPNVAGLKAKIKGRRWDYYKVDHVNYFRASDLCSMATDLDIEILAVRGYQHFSYPQNVLWKDLIKSTLAAVGFKDVISIFLKTH